MARESHQLAWVGRGVTEAARSEGIQRAIQTYHQRAPRAKQDTTTGRECFRGGSERHRTHGQQEAASNTGHPPGWGREARPKAGTPFRTKKNFGSVAKNPGRNVINLCCNQSPYYFIFFCFHLT